MKKGQTKKDGDLAGAIRRYKEGALTTKEICRECKVSPATLYRALREGEKNRPAGRRPLRGEDFDEALRRYRNGESAKEACKACRASKSTLLRAVRADGDVRKKGRPGADKAACEKVEGLRREGRTAKEACEAAGISTSAYYRARKRER